MIAIVIAALLLMAFVGVANCVLTGRTCAPPGTLREMLEDALMAALGFVGGRYMAEHK